VQTRPRSDGEDVGNVALPARYRNTTPHTHHHTAQLTPRPRCPNPSQQRSRFGPRGPVFWSAVDAKQPGHQSLALSRLVVGRSQTAISCSARVLTGPHTTPFHAPLTPPPLQNASRLRHGASGQGVAPRTAQGGHTNPWASAPCCLSQATLPSPFDTNEDSCGMSRSRLAASIAGHARYQALKRAHAPSPSALRLDASRSVCWRNGAHACPLAISCRWPGLYPFQTCVHRPDFWLPRARSKHVLKGWGSLAPLT
jgi:hypothetical protein